MCGGDVIRAVNADPAPLSTFSLRCVVEWRSVWALHHNVVLQGPEAATEAILLLLKPCLREPVLWKPRAAPLTLPPSGVGGFVLQGVGGLDAEEQTRLLTWLEDSDRRSTQIVSTTAPSAVLACRARPFRRVVVLPPECHGAGC
jgi:hypothetical protein